MPEYILQFDQLTLNDIARVGGKNASLGEIINQLTSVGVRVPGGFAVTADAYREFISYNAIDEQINQHLEKIDVENIALLREVAHAIRQLIIKASIPDFIRDEIAQAYQYIEQSISGLSVAVRSSATAEDLPDASFAGQQETFLNVRGIANVLNGIKAIYASLFNDRAIAYRVHQNFAHKDVAISVSIQQMVRSDIGVSGVMFTLDTESGFDDVVLINANYGLGETVVQGLVNPDEFYVHKPTLRANRYSILMKNLGSKNMRMIYADAKRENENTMTETVPENERDKFCLTDIEIEALARQALLIEEHYQRPMDIEWAKDGKDGHIYLVQARPETVQHRTFNTSIERYKISAAAEVMATGKSIGHKIGQGKAKLILDLKEMHYLQAGDVLVTDMTDPNWEPAMKLASAIVTNRGGRTCHAAIIARELGVPAVVGCNDITDKVIANEMLTISCAQGNTGYVYRGRVPYTVKHIDLHTIPKLSSKIMMNVGNPDHAFALTNIPNDGVGLARMEFIINRMIGIHPRALLEYENLPDLIHDKILKKIAAYSNPTQFYIDKLAEGIATIAAAFSPKPVIVRLSDFKSNEYINLIGGELYEPKEENPMLGFRGVSRYVSETFKECFQLECHALKKVRHDMGLTNVEIMVPFVRTVQEAKAVVSLLAENGLKRGDNGLRLIMMCEIPANSLLADEFLEYFDGFSIGSNDLTQMTLAVDRDSSLVANLFDECDPAVKILIKQAIDACHAANKYIGICGQAPSDHPALARWLLEKSISSLSLNPDTVLETYMSLGK